MILEATINLKYQTVGAVVMALVAVLHEHNQQVSWMHILTEDGEMSEAHRAEEPTAHLLHLKHTVEKLVEEVEPIGAFSLLVGTRTKPDAFEPSVNKLDRDPVLVWESLIHDQGLTLAAAVQTKGSWPALPVVWEVVPHGGACQV